MKKSFLTLLIFLLAAINFIAQDKHEITVEDLWAMKRLGEFDVSPDGKLIVFSTTQYDMEKNSGQSDIWIMNADGSNLKTLRNSEEDESEPIFTPNGEKVAYIFRNQIWQCDLNGKNNQQLTDLYTGASGIEWSADGKKLLFVSDVYPDCESQDCNQKRDDEKDKNPVKAKLLTELMYKHWNKWRGDKRSHLFMMNMENREIHDLTKGQPFDVPPLALGSSNDYSFSPDGIEVAFATNTSDFIATSTNNDVFILSLENDNENMDISMKKISTSKGNDNQPIYSPDGNYIAFRSMERAGFEADKYRLFLYNRKTKELKNVTGDLDISIGEMVWSEDSKYIYYISANQVYESIYRIDVHSGENELIKKEISAKAIYLSHNNGKIYFKNQRATLPYELFSVNIDGADLNQLTNLNKKILSTIEMNEIETFWSDGAEGAKVQSILVKPPFFDADKKYPMIFLIHGGPQGHWEDEFHYRWNLQMFASKGYVVIAPNPRGSTGYGQKFTDEISLDWGGKPYIDLMAAYDYAVKNFEFIDSKNTFAAGASYGGYMINWIEGQTDRFNALVSHDGVYNLTSMYGGTEELWFPEWEYGGAPWESKEIYEKWSPHNYAENFKTPMLVVHGAKDFRVPEGQAFELFTALQRKGVESKLLYFPDEYHFVVKPLNAQLWWNTIFEWFDNYIKQ